MNLLKRLFMCVLLIALILSFNIGTGFLMEAYYMQKYGGDNVFYTCNPVFSIQVFSYLFFLIMSVYMWTGFGFFGNVSEQCTWNTRKKIQITVIILLSVAVINLICTQWYTKVTLEGVQVHHFFHVQEYTWQDGKSYTLRSVHDGTLGVEITMKDGKCIELLYAPMATSSDGYDEMFPDGDYDFFPWLAVQLKNAKCHLQIKDEDKLQEQLAYPAEQELAQEMIRIAHEK